MTMFPYVKENPKTRLNQKKIVHLPVILFLFSLPFAWYQELAFLLQINI